MKSAKYYGQRIMSYNKGKIAHALTGMSYKVGPAGIEPATNQVK